jgi:hypothetical protein
VISHLIACATPVVQVSATDKSSHSDRVNQ